DFLDFLRQCRKYSLLTFSVLAYSTILSSLTILKMYALRAGAWDLGNYNQAMYSFVCCGKPFAWTADILNNPGGSLFGIHFSPIFFTFVPFYFLYPRPETLLIIQSIGIGIAAVPVFFLGKKQLGTNNWGYAFAISYLLNPLTLGLNWFDFHPEAFIPATVLFSLYFLQEKQWAKLAISWTLALSTIENIGLLLALLATYMIYS